MKVNHSVAMLDLSFKKLQTSNIKNDDGSITPKTTTKKAILDKVEINPINLEEYQKNMNGKTDTELSKLRKEQALNDQKIEPLQKLAVIDQAFNKNLTQVQLTLALKQFIRKILVRAIIVSIAVYQQF